MSEYSSVGDYGNCLFCQIAQKKRNPLGNGFIYEDDEFMAWLSPFPNTLGFTVIIPKNHASSDVLELHDDLLSRFVLVAKKVSTILKNYFDDVGRVGLIMEGTGINHAHIKLFPMHKTEYLAEGEWKQVPSGINTYFSQYEGYIQSNDGPQADFEKLEELAKNIRKTY